MISYDDKDYIDTVLSHLPPSERYLIDARYFDNRSYRDIASDFAVTGGMVGNMMFRIKRMCLKISEQLDRVRVISVDPVVSPKSSFYLNSSGKPARRRNMRKRHRREQVKRTDELIYLLRASRTESTEWLEEKWQRHLEKQQRYKFMERVNKFQEDLAKGEVSERELMNLCEEQGKTPMKPKGLFKGYDFFVCETKLAYEVKRDYKSLLTGNVVIETEMPVGKPSGLRTTRADYWIFDLPECYVFIRVSRLRDLVWMEKLKLCEFVGNGDTTKKAAYLAPIPKLHEYANNVYWKK